MSGISFFIGSLLPTFLISRLFLWLLKGWDGGYKKIIFSHIISILCTTLIAGAGGADGGAFAPVLAFTQYAPAQLILLFVDMIMRYKALKRDKGLLQINLSPELMLDFESALASAQYSNKNEVVIKLIEMFVARSKVK